MEKILSKVNNIYFIGIGGIGMSGLALILKEKGFDVWGSDEVSNSNTEMLKSCGIKVFLGHNSKHIDSKIDLVVNSSAVKKDNLEILKVKELGICILKRGQVLAQLCEDKETVAVSGSHGKTTTTSMLSHVFIELGYDVAIYLGGVSLNHSHSARWGKDNFIVETDESDGSFLYCYPEISIITNIDHEHMEYYKTEDKLISSFLQFARQTKEKTIGCGDCKPVLDIISKTNGISYGWEKHNVVRAQNFAFKNNKSQFDLYIENKFIFTVKIPLVGKHNCLNALAIFAFFHYFGQDLKKVSTALEFFKGTKRRFQIKDKVRGVVFIDDYAHHPTEIKAVLDAAKLLESKRIFIIVQPHRFSRVEFLFDEFKKCFDGADKVIITDIYGASEENWQGLNAENFCKNLVLDNPINIEYIPTERLVKKVPDMIKEGDVVLGLGAGSINTLLKGIIDEFKKIRN